MQSGFVLPAASSAPGDHVTDAFQPCSVDSGYTSPAPTLTSSSASSVSFPSGTSHAAATPTSASVSAMSPSESSSMQDGAFSPPRNQQLSEKQRHSVTEAQSISDMLAEIQAKLQTIGENLSQDLKRMRRWETKRPEAAHAAGLAPVLCSKGNDTAGSESLPVHDVQSPGVVQDNPNSTLCFFSGAAMDVDSGSSASSTTTALTPSVGFIRSCGSTTMAAYAPSISSSAATVTPEMFDEMPQSYGLHNLTQRTVFRADGTEDSYYALPENYPLERATPGLVSNAYVGKIEGCSNEPVQGYTNTPEKQTYDAETNGSHLVLKCFSKQQPQDNAKTSETVEQLRSPPWIVLVIHERRKEWDPGVHTSLSSTPNRDIFGMSSCVPPQSCFWRVPSSQEQYGTQFLWDPGINFILAELWWLSKGSICALRHRLAVKFGTHNYTYFSDTAAIMCCHPGILIQQRRTIAALLHFWQYILLSSVVCIWDPGIGTPFSMSLWLQGLSARIAAGKPSSWLQISELVTWRSQLTSAPYVWDTGSTLLQYKFIWLPNGSGFRDGQLLYMPQDININSSEWITNWTSTTFNGITSSEYAYTTDCLHEKWEIVHQQGVQQNYNAKNLLPSPSYLQIWLMDIIFITFLPP